MGSTAQQNGNFDILVLAPRIRLFCKLKAMSIHFLFLVLMVSLTITLSFGQIQKEDTASSSIILFVCEHGAARSTIAAAYFNRLAKERGLNYKAIFRGINPDTAISKDAENGLTGDGFNVKDWQPKLLNQYDLDSASEIVALDCILNPKDSLSKRVYYWNGIPPISKDYQAARNYILQKIAILVNELEQKKKLP